MSNYKKGPRPQQPRPHKDKSKPRAKKRPAPVFMKVHGQLGTTIKLPDGGEGNITQIYFERGAPTRIAVEVQLPKHRTQTVWMGVAALGGQDAA